MTVNYSTESLDRLEKIRKLKEAGVIVYANNYHGKMDISSILTQDSTIRSIEDIQTNGAVGTFKTAGRLMGYKTHGKIAFGKLMDTTATIQISFVKDKVHFNTGRETVENITIDEIDRSAYKVSEKFIDTGDYIGVIGDLFITQHGELTLFVSEFQILSKAVRPLPDKFHGVTDIETIYRQRYLDLIMSHASYERLRLRSKYIRVLRDFYEKHKFVEVETPVL